MIKNWSFLFLLIAVPVAFCACAALIGIGVLREGPPGWIASFGILLVVLPPMALVVSKYLRWFLYSTGLMVWALSILYIFPVFFPGERGMALHVGCSMLSVPNGLAEHAEDFFPKLPDGLSPLTMAIPAMGTLIQPPSRNNLDMDAVVLPVEQHGTSISAPLTISDTEIWLLFDTGASLTTLSPKALEKLGVSIPEDAPVVQLRTANGIRDSQLVLIPDVWFGGLEVGNVTVAVCEPCADEKTDGLLGLNISGRFLVTLDSTREELIIQQTESPTNITSEIKPWVDIEATVKQWPDGRTEIDVSAKNIADVAISTAEVMILCDAKYTAYLGDIRPGETLSTRLALPLVTSEESSCERFQVGLNYAQWAY
jgi:hypothetical protein